MVEVPERTRPYLRRAYSVADADPDEGSVEFLIKTIGPGTAALEEMPEESACAPARPPRQRLPASRTCRPETAWRSSRAASARRRSRRCCARSGGPGSRATSISAAATRESSRSATRFEGRVPGETILATDDGSLGEKGFVTEALARRLAGGARYARLYACGPMPMFAALAKVVGTGELPSEFSTEAEMGCGFGACLGCVIPGTEKPFIVSCSEGPILSPEKIKW